MKILKSETGDTEPLVFDTPMMIQLLEDFRKFGFLQWAEKVEAWKRNLWIIPKCEGSHWTLIIVVFPRKQFIYIDSIQYGSKFTKQPKGNPNPSDKLLGRLCKFIEKTRGKKDIPPLNWKE